MVALVRAVYVTSNYLVMQLMSEFGIPASRHGRDSEAVCVAGAHARSRGFRFLIGDHRAAEHPHGAEPEGDDGDVDGA